MVFELIIVLELINRTVRLAFGAQGVETSAASIAPKSKWST